MNLLRVQAFGKLQLNHDGHILVSFPTRHVEELLGFLLLNQQTKHHREKLINILWPDSAPDEARGKFSTALWRLRTLLNELDLPAMYLHATRDWVAFTPTPSPSLDLDRFQSLLKEAAVIEDSDARENTVRRAIDVYQGELLEGIFSDWCLLERERLARLHLRAVGQLMSCCISQGRYEEAVDWGYVVLQADPLREEVHRAIMLCQWRLGQRTLAVKQFQICARGLMEELQLLPLPETIALYRQIVMERFKFAAEDERNKNLQAEINTVFKEFQQAGRKLNTFLDNPA